MTSCVAVEAQAINNCMVFLVSGLTLRTTEFQDTLRYARMPSCPPEPPLRAIVWKKRYLVQPQVISRARYPIPAAMLLISDESLRKGSLKSQEGSSGSRFALTQAD